MNNDTAIFILRKMEEMMKMFGELEERVVRLEAGFDLQQPVGPRVTEDLWKKIDIQSFQDYMSQRMEKKSDDL